MKGEAKIARQFSKTSIKHKEHLIEHGQILFELGPGEGEVIVSKLGNDSNLGKLSAGEWRERKEISSTIKLSTLQSTAHENYLY